MRLTQGILTILLLASAVIGDYIVFQSKYSESRAFRAVADSITHATIGFISSAIFFSYKLNISSDSSVYGMIVCTILSFAIDIDHAIVARSFNFKDMLNLKHRGIFHSTTFWLLITVIMLTYGYLMKEIKIYLSAFIVMMAYSSHHIRDANRRGIWLNPFGSTPPLTKFLYITLIAVLPHIFVYIFLNFRQYFVKNYVTHIV